MKIKTHNDLEVYKLSFDAAMKIYKISKKFPIDERYSLTDQMRRSSRSVSANISEAYRSRRYEKSFVSKLIIAECEAAETQTWLEFSLACGYIDKEQFTDLISEYNHIIAMIVNMTRQVDKWVL